MNVPRERDDVRQPCKARCLRCHLSWEESVIFPRLVELGFSDLVERWLVEHRAWQAAIARGEKPELDERMIPRLDEHAAEEEALCAELVTAGELWPELCAELHRDHERIERGD